MWVLVVAAWFAAQPTPAPKAALLAVFPTARECLAAKRDLEKMFQEEAGPEMNSYGFECAEVKTDNVPKKARPAEG